MRRHALLIATCVALGGISAYAALMYRLRNAQTVLRIVDPSVLHLGQVNVQDRCSRTIRLVNSGPNQVTIGDIKASCGCVKVTPTTFTLEPGKARDVTLDFDFLLVTNRNDIPESARFGVTLYALTMPPHREVFQWQLTGIIKSVFRRVPQVVEFRSQGPLEQPVSGVFDVEFHQPIDDLDVTVQEPGIDLLVDRDPDDRVFHIHVKGVFHDFERKRIALDIRPNVGGVAQSPVESLVYLEKRTDVRAEPAFINFGIIDANQPSSANIRLVSSSDAEFQVLSTHIRSNDSLGISDRSLVVESAGAKPGLLVVTPYATEAGTHTGSVVFEIQQHGAKYEVAVPYSFHIARSKDKLALD